MAKNVFCFGRLSWLMSKPLPMNSRLKPIDHIIRIAKEPPPMPKPLFSLCLCKALTKIFDRKLIHELPAIKSLRPFSTLAIAVPLRMETWTKRVANLVSRFSFEAWRKNVFRMFRCWTCHPGLERWCCSGTKKDGSGCSRNN